MNALALAQVPQPRRRSQAAGGPATAFSPAPTSSSTLRLPMAVADRIADLMADDPALAEAVNAQLPAARLLSAHDLAGYGDRVTTGRRLDISG